MDVNMWLMVAALAISVLSPLAHGWLAKRQAAGGGGATPAPAPAQPVQPGPLGGTLLPHILALLQQLAASGQPIDPKHPLLGTAMALLQAELASRSSSPAA